MKLSHVVGMLVVGGLAVGVQVGAAQYGGSTTSKKPAAKPAAKAAAKPAIRPEMISKAGFNIPTSDQ